MSFDITIPGGQSRRLLTGGKYCPDDIVVTVTGSGAELPELSNPGSAGDLMAGKQLIDGDGVPVTGTFTIAPELAEQAALIDEIRVAVQSKTVAAPVIEALEITGNGTYTAPDGVDGYAPITVNVPVPEGYIKPEGTLEITENGEYDVTAYEGVSVQVAGSGGSGPDLPEGYQRCDFIQFNGSNMVDTGIIGDQDTQIFASFTWENSTQRYLLGCAHADNTAAITAYMNGSWRFGDKVASKSFSLKNPLLPFSALLNNTTIGSTSGVTTISGVNDFETIGTLLFGACRSSNGSVPSTGIVGKGFRLVIWKHGERLLELIPVTDGSAYRFWDVIGKKFHDSITSTPLDGGNW